MEPPLNATSSVSARTEQRSRVWTAVRVLPRLLAVLGLVGLLVAGSYVLATTAEEVRAIRSDIAALRAELSADRGTIASHSARIATSSAQIDRIERDALTSGPTNTRASAAPASVEAAGRDVWLRVGREAFALNTEFRDLTDAHMGALVVDELTDTGVTVTLEKIRRREEKGFDDRVFLLPLPGDSTGEAIRAAFAGALRTLNQVEQATYRKVLARRGNDDAGARLATEASRQWSDGWEQLLGALRRHNISASDLR